MYVQHYTVQSTTAILLDCLIDKPRNVLVHHLSCQQLFYQYPSQSTKLPKHFKLRLHALQNMSMTIKYVKRYQKGYPEILLKALIGGTVFLKLGALSIFTLKVKGHCSNPVQCLQTPLNIKRYAFIKTYQSILTEI